MCAGLGSLDSVAGPLLLVPCSDESKVLKFFKIWSKLGKTPDRFYIVTGDTSLNKDAACRPVSLKSSVKVPKAGDSVILEFTGNDDVDTYDVWSRTGDDDTTSGFRIFDNDGLRNIVCPGPPKKDYFPQEFYPAKCGGLCLAADAQFSRVVLADCAQAAKDKTLLVANLQIMLSGYAEAVMPPMFCGG